MPKRTPRIYPLSALRAVALHAQRLDAPLGAEPVSTPDAIYQTVEALGCVQIDTLHMVHRAHYLTLWSRLGAYDIDDYHRLIYTPESRRLYEYWGHAASIIPLAHYRYQAWKMERYRSSPGHWFSEWLKDDGNRALVEQVLERIRADGPMRAADFHSDSQRRGSWWDWKPAKLALELLFERGELMVTDRVNFQRVYDVKERVLPEWVDTTPAPAEEAHRFHIEQAARALGVARPMQLTDYAYMKRTTAKPFVAALIQAGALVEIQGELADGSTAPLVVHRECLPLLDQAADGALRAERTTFLNPFDSLFWAADRDEELWGFEQVLECYVPGPKRRYGYYTMPILHRDRLVGRFDPKLERKAGVLRLKALYLEPGVAPDEELVAGVAVAMRDFMAWHRARELVIERSDPVEFRERLLAAL